MAGSRPDQSRGSPIKSATIASAASFLAAEFAAVIVAAAHSPETVPFVMIVASSVQFALFANWTLAVLGGSSASQFAAFIAVALLLCSALLMLRASAMKGSDGEVAGDLLAMVLVYVAISHVVALATLVLTKSCCTRKA